MQTRDYFKVEQITLTSKTIRQQFEQDITRPPYQKFFAQNKADRYAYIKHNYNRKNNSRILG